MAGGIALHRILHQSFDEKMFKPPIFAEAPALKTPKDS